MEADGQSEVVLERRDQVGGVEVVFVGSGEADSFIIGEAQQLRKAGCPHVSLKPPCPVPCFQAPPHAWASTAGRLPLFCLFNSRRVAVEDRMIHFFLGTHTIFFPL